MQAKDTDAMAVPVQGVMGSGGPNEGEGGCDPALGGLLSSEDIPADEDATESLGVISMAPASERVYFANDSREGRPDTTGTASFGGREGTRLAVNAICLSHLLCRYVSTSMQYGSGGRKGRCSVLRFRTSNWSIVTTWKFSACEKSVDDYAASDSLWTWQSCLLDRDMGMIATRPCRVYLSAVYSRQMGCRRHRRGGRSLGMYWVDTTQRVPELTIYIHTRVHFVHLVIVLHILESSLNPITFLLHISE